MRHHEARHADGVRSQVVDTVLAKLHVSLGKLPELHALIDQPNSLDISEIEPELVKSRNISVLCKLYQKSRDDAKLLDIWSRLVDGKLRDPQVQDPLSRIFDLLAERKDRGLIQKWTSWLVKQDPDRALKVCLYIGHAMAELILPSSWSCL